MSLYKVTCFVISQFDASIKPIKVVEEGKHPDLIKGLIEKKHKGKILSQIQIEDITPSPKLWSERKEKSKIDMKKTWNKELLR